MPASTAAKAIPTTPDCTAATVDLAAHRQTHLRQLTELHAMVMNQLKQCDDPKTTATLLRLALQLLKEQGRTLAVMEAAARPPVSPARPAATKAPPPSLPDKPALAATKPAGSAARPPGDLDDSTGVPSLDVPLATGTTVCPGALA